MARHARYDRKTALEKAVGLFWEKGYHGSSMKQIEQALDMRPGSIYATFGSKDGLFSEALAAYAEQGGRDLAVHLKGYDSIVDGPSRPTAFLLPLSTPLQTWLSRPG